MSRYPRNLRGYGQNPPHVHWPKGAKIALQFVLNYEEGGENNILHGDEASEAFLSEIVGATQWPQQRHANMESIYEYGARAGFWRLHRLFTEKNIPLTVYGVATALARSPEVVNAMNEANWEIASHGLKWIEYKDASLEKETRDMHEAIQLHYEVTGARPKGWYTGRSSSQTLEMIAKNGSFLYVSDAYADDLPYWIKCEENTQLVIPYTLDANDMRFATPQGFNAGDQFFNYLKDSFDALYREGAEGQAKMMSIGMHCRLLGRPGRAESIRKFLEYAMSFDDVWFAKREDIAHHWHKHHPYEEGLEPSTMAQAAFVDQFGAVFEHSPFIAERAYLLELGAAHDCAVGIWNALCRVFRAASYEERLGVLTAHPDLAGKLAAAKRLTAESTDEQASAGLDALTDQERENFTALNKAYVEKHGFPFIIAVREHDKDGILANFKARIDRDTPAEFEAACYQVERIALHRLKAMFSK